MSFLVISTSLNPSSSSFLLAREAFERLNEKHKTNWLDLRECELPLCDGESAYSHPNVAKAAALVKEATCILVATPVYNFDCNSAAKNLIELTGRNWEDKTVGFLCAAGGRASYMSIMGLANSLMLDFRSLIIPRFVYADGSAFSNGEISDQSVLKRIGELCEAAVRLDGAAMKENAR